MSPKILVSNDLSVNFQLSRANIFTAGQGICLQREFFKSDEYIPSFAFDHALGIGSWYDIQIVCQVDGKIQWFLRKGFYLSHGKSTTLSKLTKEKHRDNGKSWTCKRCFEKNLGSVRICEYCYTNKVQSTMFKLSFIPLIGIPFSMANAILSSGRAAESDKVVDVVDATLATTFLVIDIVTAPFIIGSLVKLPAKFASQTGVKWTVNALLGSAGKPFVKACSKTLRGRLIVATVKIANKASKFALDWTAENQCKKEKDEQKDHTETEMDAKKIESRLANSTTKSKCD